MTNGKRTKRNKLLGLGLAAALALGAPGCVSLLTVAGAGKAAPVLLPVTLPIDIALLPIELPVFLWLLHDFAHGSWHC